MKKMVETQEYAAWLPGRVERSNKGTYGTLLLGAGSMGMAGAAVLAAMAAGRMGTGIVAVISEECNRTILQSTVPEALFHALHYPITLDDTMPGIAGRATALALGPGIGTSAWSEGMAKKILEAADGGRGRGKKAQTGEKAGALPMVLDADALNLLAAGRLVIPEAVRQAGVVITPHPGEMSRLCGLPVSRILEDPAAAAEEYARRMGVICLLKDHRSVITDGSVTVINPTGCDGMATAGSGDVLTGIIGALLAQGCPPLRSAALGAYIHGAAGEAAQAQLGARSVMARDIIGHIPRVLMKLDSAGNGDQDG